MTAAAVTADAQRVLVAYASKHGSTRAVAEVIATTIRSLGVDVDERAAEEVEDVEPYDTVVLGTAIYMGRMHEEARNLLGAHRDELAGRRLAVFALGPRTLADDDVESTRSQLEKGLAKASVEADLTAIFGGVVDPTKLRFPFNRMDASDARDWDEIQAWGCEVGARVRGREWVRRRPHVGSRGRFGRTCSSTGVTD